MSDMSLSTLPNDAHIRPIHLRIDLTAVTDLVEQCFAEHMDAEGRAYLRNMRRIGREGDPYYLDASAPETSPVPFHGYVYVENKQIIGNITLIYLQKKDKNIYFIANVAVDPKFRGQGIGRKLTSRALQHVREHNGSSVILQVREDNPTAIHLYQSLGFYEMTRRTSWGFDQRPEFVPHKNNPSIHIQRRKKENWIQQKKWLEELYPEKVTWFLPFQLSKYEPGFLNSFNRWLNSESLQFLEGVENDHLLGLATLEGINPFQDFLWLATSPAYEETIIPPLVSFIAHRALFPKKIQVNYPAQRAVSSFQSAGMVELNTLIWMENTLSVVPG
jgi:ribosomal protein S18 acetylase RimI-like enzyme